MAHPAATARAPKPRTFNDARATYSTSPELAWWVFMRISGFLLVFLTFGHLWANNMAFNAVAEGFLGQCLGGRAEPIGDLAGSSIEVPTGADIVPGLAEALEAHTPEVRN